jgi:hypothetical protein
MEFAQRAQTSILPFFDWKYYAALVLFLVFVAVFTASSGAGSTFSCNAGFLSGG